MIKKTWNSPTKKREDKERLWCVPVRLFKLQMSRILISSKLPVAFALFTASMLFSSCGGPLLTLVYCYYCSSFTRRLPRLLFIHSSTHSSLQKKLKHVWFISRSPQKKTWQKGKKCLKKTGYRHSDPLSTMPQSRASCMTGRMHVVSIGNTEKISKKCCMESSHALLCANFVQMNSCSAWCIFKNTRASSDPHHQQQ